jgi:hypothetical protein
MSLHQNEARKERKFSFQECECCGAFGASETLNTSFLSRKCLDAHGPLTGTGTGTMPSATRFAHAGPFFDLGVLLYLQHDTTRHDHIISVYFGYVSDHRPRLQLSPTKTSESHSRSEKTFRALRGNSEWSALW